jgi:type I restriction enzyme S subunit
VQIKDSARVPKELWVESGIRYLRSSDLENNGQGGELFISIEAYENYKSKTGVPERGDVLFNSGGDIGFSILKTDDSPVYVQGGAILYARTSQSKEIDGGYLNVYFSTPQMKSI